MLAITAQLIVELEGQVIQTVPLTMPVLGIGRSPESALSLPHNLVSRNHAELHMTAQGPVLTDLASSNGTFSGEQRLLPNQPHVLSDGSSFRIGPYILTYQVVKPISPTLKRADEVAPEPALPDVATVAQVISFAVQPEAQPREKLASSQIAARSESIYQRFLPDIYQENDFLRRFLHIFEDIWEPLEQRQDHISMYFDPSTSPAAFLSWLASWLDLSFNEHWPEARRRHLLAQAMELYRWRGTPYGLIRMIEVCAGVTPVIKELPTEPFIFHISVTLPPTAASSAVDKDLIESLIQTHKPAYAGYILEVTPSVA